MRDFVLHGTEPAGAAPLLRAKSIVVDLKLLASLKQYIDIRALDVDTPQANILVYPDGSTNVPAPKVKKPSDKSALQTVVDLAIGRFDLHNGYAAFADRKVPINAHGQNLRAQRGAGNKTDLRDVLDRPQAFEREKEKGPVFLNWPTQAASELVLPEGRNSGKVGE